MEHATGTDEPMLKSLDGVTSPVSFTRGPSGTIEVSMLMSRNGFDYLMKLADETGEPLETVIGRSLVLFKAATDAAREGKAVGAAADPEALDIEFTGL